MTPSTQVLSPLAPPVPTAVPSHAIAGPFAFTVPDAGVAERKGVGHVRDRFSYPRTTDVLRLTITPDAGAVSSR